MNLITLDMETFYSQEYSLTKLTTEEYIRDKRFEVIGVGVKVNDEDTVWVTGTHDDVSRYLTQLPWSESALLCHNTMFDGAILAWIFGITPSLYLDTLSMARAFHGVDAGGSLAKLVERYGLGVKGTEVLDAKGKLRTGFTPSELAQYGEYCKNDVELTLKLFRVLVENFPEDELQLIDMTLKMFIQPVLELDDALLVDRLEEVRAEKQALLGTLKEKLNCEAEEDVRKKLASNKQFAELLKEHGVEPPLKTSKTTGKLTFALAKNDEGFIALTEHEDPFIQQLCAVRLGTKSTIEESRIERFINVGARNKGKLPIPLKYYGAHTGRWAGADKVNFQNLPSRDKKKKALKNAVIAPDGYMVINCDSSQIEARVLAWLAGQEDVVGFFRKNNEEVAQGVPKKLMKSDPYKIMAAAIYDVEVLEVNDTQRFVGKTVTLGLGYGTGATKLQHTLKTTPPGCIVDDEEAKRIVSLYRETNYKIIELWRDGDMAIRNMANWEPNDKPYFYGEHQCLQITQHGVRLPNGLYIRYPDLKIQEEEGKLQYIYKSRKGPVSLWGGSLVENVVQALARIIVGQQMIRVSARYRPALTVHDAAVCVVKEDEVEDAMRFITGVMSEPPEWAKGLPVACEAGVAKSYGDC